MKCKCLSKTFNLLKEIFALIWQHCLLHSYPLSHSSCKHMAVDLKSNQEKTNFISAFYKLTILTENNVHFLIRKKRRKRLFPTFVQTLVSNMTFFCTVLRVHKPNIMVHNGLRIGIKGTSNSGLLNVVKILSGSISPCQLYLKHIK